MGRASVIHDICSQNFSDKLFLQLLFNSYHVVYVLTVKTLLPHFLVLARINWTHANFSYRQGILNVWPLQINMHSPVSCLPSRSLLPGDICTPLYSARRIGVCRWARRSTLQTMLSEHQVHNSGSASRCTTVHGERK